MNDIIVRQFALDIERNSRDIAKLNKQVKSLKRRNFIFGALALGAIAYAFFLDKHVEEELEKYEDIGELE